MDLTYDSEASDRSVIKSLDGIKIFRNLKNLECDFNALTSLDLSGMDKLEYLSCTYNKISSLNLKGCTSLVQFYANVNELTALDLSDSDKGTHNHRPVPYPEYGTCYRYSRNSCRGAPDHLYRLVSIGTWARDLRNEPSHQ